MTSNFNEIISGDYVNSKEYRKPEWVTRMEEIQQRLAEQPQSAKFTNELREVRVREGMKAKLEATYAGNPRPTFTWQFNRKDLPESESFRIKVRDHIVSLTIYETTMAMAGEYTCIAKNDLGTDTTRAGVKVNKALTAEEKKKLEELAEAEKAKASLKKKQEEEKKKKLEELAQQQKEQHRLQQEQRKTARSSKPKEKEAPKVEQKIVKKRPEQKPEPKPEEPKEVPKLKKVEQVKAASPVRRSQSPELRDRLKRVDSPRRAELPAPRPESPMARLKPTPKKGSPAPEKAKTHAVKKQVTKTVSDKQSVSKDTGKQSISDIELNKKDQKVVKPTETTPQKEVSPPAKKTSPQKEVLHEQQQHLDKQKDLKSKIDADVGVVDEIDTSSKKTEIVETDDIPALEVVPEPQATFKEYPEELIKDAIKIDKPVPSPQIVLEAVAKELESVSMNEVEKPTISQKKDLDEGISLKPETPIQKEEQKVPTSIPKDETHTTITNSCGIRNY